MDTGVETMRSTVKNFVEMMKTMLRSFMERLESKSRSDDHKLGIMEVLTATSLIIGLVLAM